jgi:hypothetical protein
MTIWLTMVLVTRPMSTSLGTSAIVWTIFFSRSRSAAGLSSKRKSIVISTVNRWRSSLVSPPMPSRSTSIAYPVMLLMSGPTKNW